MSTQPSGPGPDSANPSWQVRGNPTEAELAAVVAVVTAAAAAAAVTPGSATHPAGASDGSAWAAYWRNLRSPLPVGPGAWRASGQPRG